MEILFINVWRKLTFDGVIGGLPGAGEGEALAKFDSVFLTQFHWELFSRSNFSHRTRQESTSELEVRTYKQLQAKLLYTVKIIKDNYYEYPCKKRGGSHSQKGQG